MDAVQVEASIGLGEEVPKSLAQPVNIHLVETLDIKQCPFWVGGFRKGKLTPQDLYPLSTEQMFESASIVGVNESEPIMISDVANPEPRYVYLVPYGQGFGFDDVVDSLMSSVESWVPKKIGIYLAPEIFGENKMHHSLLLRTLFAFVEIPRVNDYYLLTGGYGVNEILGITLRFKRDFNSNAKEILVFHR